MNALVGVRSNATGFLSPTPETRAAVTQQLAATAASRSGESAVIGSALGETAETTGGTGASLAETASNELGKDVFLQLLVLQMQNQDPLSPLENTEMVAQLAQFSALEAATNLNEQFEVLSGNVDQLNFISGAQLLGKTVTGVDVNGEIQTGVVESVQLDGSLVVLTVNGQYMPMSGILSITPAVQGEAVE
jgi:flagellar basal-body rod modification protein FlgD